MKHQISITPLCLHPIFISHLKHNIYNITTSFSDLPTNQQQLRYNLHNINLLPVGTHQLLSQWDPTGVHPWALQLWVREAPRVFTRGLCNSELLRPHGCSPVGFATLSWWDPTGVHPWPLQLWVAQTPRVFTRGRSPTGELLHPTGVHPWALTNWWVATPHGCSPVGTWNNPFKYPFSHC